MTQVYTCPHTESCLVYKNWTKQTKDSRLDVISGIPFGIPGKVSYSCLALTAIQDPITEGGTQISEDLEKRLISKPKELQCSHIALLNLVAKLL